MPTVRNSPLLGLCAQIALLAALAATVGLTLAGWLSGVGYALIVCAGLSHGLRRSGADRLGRADWVTLCRAAIAGGVTALVADSFIGPTPVGLLVTLTAVALALDALDGYVARRTGTATPLGARFDMEADAFLILVLSVFVARSAGGWVIIIGAMRYAFVAVGWVLPWMRGSLPGRYWRKVVAATQGIVLAVAASGLLPDSIMIEAVAISLGLLVESFGRDVWWLWCHRAAAPSGRAAAPSDPGVLHVVRTR